MSQDSLEKFKDFWSEQADKIEKGVIDDHGVHMIYLQYRVSQGILRLNLQRFTSEIWLELEMIGSRLRVALEMARTRYSLQSKSLWAKITDSLARIVWRNVELSRFPKLSSHP